jgi:hypothetical protein
MSGDLGKEVNTANTIDWCTSDGSSGTHFKDESIEKVVVRSGEINEASNNVMTVGQRITIIASVYAWSTGASDTADFYYTSDPSNPNPIWQYIGSVTPPDGGEQDLKISYTLPQGAIQAVRVQFRFGGTIGTCVYGSYNDRDDLVFAVAPAIGMPTPSPVKTLPPTKAVGGGPQQALYDSTLTVPRCHTYGSSCDSLGLLNGRGLLKFGNEPNTPNTLDWCNDGSSGTFHDDESVDRILVRSGEVDGTGSGVDMVEGGRVTIVATVHPWRSGSSDYADFYYSSSSSNPQWQLIGTAQPSGSGIQELKMAYTLPQGGSQAVRVNFRYRGAQGTNGACSDGAYDDADDIAFEVKSNPSFAQTNVSQVIFTEEPKDIDTDLRKRKELLINIEGRRKRTKAAKPAEVREPAN